MARPAFPKGDVSYVEALESTARSGAHGFRSPPSSLTADGANYCRIRAKSAPSAALILVLP